MQTKLIYKEEHLYSRQLDIILSLTFYNYFSKQERVLMLQMMKEILLYISQQSEDLSKLVVFCLNLGLILMPEIKKAWFLMK
jgi:hypothetical protein